MSAAQRTLIRIALLLVAAGIALGFFHATVVRYNTMPVLQYQAHWTAASPAAESGAEAAIRAAEYQSYTYTRVVDAHTHIIKLATVLLLIAILYPLIALPEKRRRMVAIAMVVGIFVFPLGVLSEIYLRGPLGPAVAAIGAMLVILSFAGLVWGLHRSSVSRTSG